MPLQNFDSLLSFIKIYHEKFGMSLAVAIKNDLKYRTVSLPMTQAIAIYSLRYMVKERRGWKDLVGYKTLLKNLKAASEDICKIHIVISEFEEKAQMIFTNSEKTILYGELISPKQDVNISFPAE
ncbi:MAG: hypothetical protein ABL872_19425 [Lacibacter sp.]